MPIIDPLQFNSSKSPDFKSALKSAGLISQDPQNNVSDQLDKVGLTSLEVLNVVANEMRSGETSQVRLKAAEIGLKLNGLLSRDDSGVNIPHVTIVIKDAEYANINPILLPRPQMLITQE